MKTLILPMRFLVLLLAVCIGLPSNVHAKDITYTNHVNKVDLTTSTVINVIDPLYTQSGVGVDFVRNYTAIPTLVYNRNSKTDIAGNVWSYEIEYDLLYSDPVAGQSIAKSGILFIEHNNTKGIYESIGIHEQVVGDVKLRVNSITPTGDVPHDIHLELKLKVERYDYLDETDPITKNEMVLVSSSNNQVEVAWQPVEGAEYYELEWVFWDTQFNTQASVLNSMDLETVFERAVSIETKSTSHQFDLFYPAGIVYVRVRPIGRYIRNVGSNYEHLKYGTWVQGINPSTNSLVIGLFLGFEADEIWQVQRNFAENAKSKQVIQYFDEAMKGRQTLTNLSSNDLTIVNENVYDTEGRPSLTILPVPVRKLTGKNPLEFGAGTDATTITEGGLISTGAIDYTRKDFDKTSYADPLIKVDAQGKEHVSNVYYSSENPFDNHIHRNYIPDAENFPVTQVKFLNDATGRIARQSGVGAFYQLGSDHETKYFYSNPTHAELRRLFGKNIGDEIHYRKNYVVDANGQISVSYINQGGQTIATALAGKSPENVNALESELDATNTIKSSIIGKNVIDESEQLSTLSHSIFCDEAPRTDKFTYTLKGGAMYLPHVTTSICIGCQYQVNISLIDENGITIPLILPTPSNNGSAPIFNGITVQSINGEIVVDYNSLHQNTCTPIPTVDIEFEATLSNVGSYTLRKVLRVIEPNPNQLITHLENNDVLEDKQTFIEQYITANWDPNECDDCNDNIRLKLAEEIAAAEDPIGANGEIGSLEYQRYFDLVQYYLLNTSTYPDCDDLRKILALETGLTRECDAKLELMKQQIAPASDPSTGAQGCLYGENGFWQNVYNTSNPIVIESYDNNGNVITNTFSNQTQFINFIQNDWQEHFVEVPEILQGHPEYCAYESYCLDENTLKGRRFDFELAGLETWAEAIDFGANLQSPINLVAEQFTKIIDMDPLFTAHPSLYAQMNANLSNYCTTMYTNNTAAQPVNVMGCGNGCSSVICYINNILGDPAQYNPNNYTSLAPPYNTINTPDITPLSNEDKWRLFRGIYAAEKAKIQQTYIDGITSCPNGAPYTGASSCDPIINGDETAQWMSDNGGGSPSNLADVQALGNTLNQDNCAAICLGNAQRWIGQLCPDMDKTDPQYQQLINHFVAFCTGECSAVGTDNPMGYIFDENLTPMDPDLAQAQAILTTHTDCGYDLVTNQPPYIDVVFANKTDVYEWNTNIHVAGAHQRCDYLSCLFNELNNNAIFPTKYTDINANCPTNASITIDQGVLVGYAFNSPMTTTSTLTHCNYTGVYLRKSQGNDDNMDVYIGSGGFSVKLINQQTGDVLNFLEIQSISNYNCLTNTVDVTILQPCTVPSLPPPYNTIGYGHINCTDINPDCSSATLLTIQAQINLSSIDGAFPWGNEGIWVLKKNQVAINIDSVKVQCEEQQIAELTRKATEAYDKYLEDQLAQLTNGDPCMAFRETMTTEYKTTEHHYTLYYYDQAGNLIQTIPPSAVIPLPDNHFDGTTIGSIAGVWDGTDPNHDYEMTTTYQYNTVGQIVEQESPDGGLTKLKYDYANRLRFSQNARQVLNDQYSYTKYDKQGRVIEIGRLDGHPVISDWNLNRTTFPEAILSVHERIITEYENASFSPIIQDNLRGRIARTYNDHIATYYSYDVHGHVKKIHNQINILGASEIEYNYDLISGNVKEVAFMSGTKDQFFHRYEYDADNRLIFTETSKNGYAWDLDAKYFYYAHGPLARIELGEDKVQGLDYMYNIQGWIKGINNTTSKRDLGQDGFIATGPGTGLPHNYNKWFGYDQAAYYLGYHREDYKTINTGIDLGVFAHSNTTIFNSDITGNGITEGLFNGNVTFMINHIPSLVPINPLTKATQAMVYEYDALHRITKSESYAYTNGWSKSGLSNAYRTAYSYDANGNIKSLDRHTLNTATSSSTHIDALSYNYGVGKLKNQLISITDPMSTTIGINDVDGMNYTYDPIGNLTTDGTNTIKWNSQDKVSTVSNNDYDITYTYDVNGHRLSKEIAPKIPSNSPIRTTFYIRDASGNIMGTYIVENIAGTFSKKLEETPIYGSSRLGIHQHNVSLDEYTPLTNPSSMNASLGESLEKDRGSNGTRGEKIFEISNHLENVLVTVSDLKLGYLTALGQTTAQGYKAEVQSAQDYYPFGWTMPGRSFNPSSYKHGFNGKENDREWGNQLIQDYGFRLYNPSIAKFLSVDPLADGFAFYTPYQFAGNMPIAAIDLDGLEVDIHTSINAKALYNPKLDVDMNNIGLGSTAKTINGNKVATTSYTKFGGGRNYVAYWNEVLKNYPQTLSPANKAKIKNGAPPVVDEVWIKHNPKHAEYAGDILIHHHKYQGRFATAIPEKAHRFFSKVLHPFNKGNKFRFGLLTKFSKKIMLVGSGLTFAFYANGQMSPVDMVDPIGAAAVVDAFMEKTDAQLLQFAFSQGFKPFMDYVNNSDNTGKAHIFYATYEEARDFASGQFTPSISQTTEQVYSSDKEASEFLGKRVSHAIIFYSPDTKSEPVPAGMIDMPVEK